MRERNNEIEGGEMAVEIDVAAQEYRDIGAQAVFEKLDKPENAFKSPMKRLTCIDEGIVEGQHLAGSGILMDQQSVIKIIEEQGIEEVSTHAGCGAAGLAAQGKGAESPAAFAGQWAQELVAAVKDKLGKEIRVVHYEQGEMQRPETHHDAEVVYYDGTGRFNRGGTDLPTGFVVTRRILDTATAQRDVQLAATIASGGHGKGEAFFNPERPFMVVVLGDSRSHLYNFEALAREVNDSMELGPGNLAVIGFDVPVEWLED